MKISIPPTEIELNEGERYVGSIIEPSGRVRHVVLLPGDEEKNWKDAMEWAGNIGGDLPDRVEQAMFDAHMPEEFKPDAYWSNTQHAGGSDFAWCQYFDLGYQLSIIKSFKLRARAVRRFQ